MRFSINQAYTIFYVASAEIKIFIFTKKSTIQLLCCIFHRVSIQSRILKVPLIALNELSSVAGSGRELISSAAAQKEDMKKLASRCHPGFSPLMPTNIINLKIQKTRKATWLLQSRSSCKPAYGC